MFVQPPKRTSLLAQGHKKLNHWLNCHNLHNQLLVHLSPQASLHSVSTSALFIIDWSFCLLGTTSFVQWHIVSVLTYPPCRFNDRVDVCIYQFMYITVFISVWNQSFVLLITSLLWTLVQRKIPYNCENNWKIKWTKNPF